MGRRRDYIEVLKTRAGIQTGEFEIFYEKRTKNYFTQTTAPELKAKNDSTCEMDHYPKEGELYESKRVCLQAVETSFY